VKAKSSGESLFHVKTKLDDFKAACGNGKCSQSSQILMSGLNGGNLDIFKCDLINILYQGVPGQALSVVYKYEKGYRDMVTPYNGYLLSFAATSIVLESAYESLDSVDVNQWRVLQNGYHNQLMFSLNRMKDID
jgi:hypothetical protein